MMANSSYITINPLLLCFVMRSTYVLSQDVNHCPTNFYQDYYTITYILYHYTITSGMIYQGQFEDRYRIYFNSCRIPLPLIINVSFSRFQKRILRGNECGLITQWKSEYIFFSICSRILL